MLPVYLPHLALLFTVVYTSRVHLIINLHMHYFFIFMKKCVFMKTCMTCKTSKVALVQVTFKLSIFMKKCAFMKTCKVALVQVTFKLSIKVMLNAAQSLDATAQCT